MKKKVIIFISIILLVGIAIFTCSHFILNKEEEHADSKKLGNAIKKEIIKVDSKSSISGYTIKDDILYYLEKKDLTSEKGEYYLNNYDIKSNSKTNKKISDNTTMFCYLNKNIVDCTDDNKSYAYDLEGNKLYELEFSEDNYYETFIKYQNSYWQLTNGELKKDKDKIKIPRYDVSFNYSDNIVIEDNTFLLLQSSNEYYIYNIKENSLMNTHEEKYFKTTTGFCFYSSTYYHIYDLKNNEDKKYVMNGFIAPSSEYLGTFNKDTIYQISNDTNQLEIYNAKKEKVTNLDLEEYIEYYIYDVSYYDNKIYIITSNDVELELISIDLNNLNNKYIDVYEYLLKQNNEIDESIKRIKEEYNVNIKIKDETEIEFPDFSSESLYNNAIIKHAIKRVDKILSKFPKNFFANFTHDTYKGLNIYLGGTLKPSDPSTQASNPVAYTLMHNYAYTIVLDSSYSEFENTVCHELMHAMENNLKNKEKKIFAKWNSLNPSDFSYYNAYNGYRFYEYIPDMTSNNKVYFVSSYSYTYPIEDRAEIFGKMCSEDTNEDIKKYPNLYKKAQAIKNELIANYPELKDSIVLKNY